MGVSPFPSGRSFLPASFRRPHHNAYFHWRFFRQLFSGGLVSLLLVLGGGTLTFFLPPPSAPTANAATTCPGSTSTQTPPTLQINELLTNPQRDWDGNGRIETVRDQWIELFNYGSTDLNIPLQLCSSENGIVLISTSIQIPAQGFFVLYESHISPGFPLNPGNGDLELLDGAGAYIDRVNYAPLSYNQSYSRNTDGTWSISNTPTPGKPNSFGAPPSPTPTATRSTGGSGGGTGKGAPTATPTPISSVFIPTDTPGSQAYQNPEHDRSSTSSGGRNPIEAAIPSWLKITLLVLMGAGLLALVVWYFRSWGQEPESDG